MDRKEKSIGSGEPNRNWLRWLVVNPLRLLSILAAILLICVYGSLAAGLAVVAIWVLWEPVISKECRRKLLFVAVPYLAITAFTFGPLNIVNYQLSHGYVYRAESIPEVRGIQIEYTGGSSGSTNFQILPGLRHSFYEGPYDVQIFLHHYGV